MSDMLFFNLFTFIKVGHGHGAQFSKWQHSVANVENLQCLPFTIALALTVSEILKFLNFYLQTVDQGHRQKLSQLHNSIANLKI